MRKKYTPTNPRSIEYLSVIEKHLSAYEARAKNEASINEQNLKYIERRRAEIEELKRKYC